MVTGHAPAETVSDFTIQSPTHGTSFTLSEARGKIVVLHFLLKTECPYCLRYTQTYARKSKDAKNIVHIFLKPDGDYEIKAWAEHLDQESLEQAPTIYRDVDAKLAKMFKIPDGYFFHGQKVHYPAMVVLDGSGKELFRYIGKDNSDRLSYEDFERKLDSSKANVDSNVKK